MEEKISIILVPAQRDLLLKYESHFTDPELFRLVSLAVKNDNQYEIMMYEHELKDLLDQIFELSNDEKDERLIYKLDDLHDYLFEFYEGDDEEMDAQDQRIMEVIGDPEEAEFEESLNAFYKYLKLHLSLPCEVTGIEDFRWEEYYVIGPGNKAEYERLKKTSPSYRDRYELLEIIRNTDSEWAICGEDDLGGRVRRISDKKDFILGLSELKATDKKSKNYELLDDYSVWFVNNRC
jgi:hypothetical protein